MKSLLRTGILIWILTCANTPHLRAQLAPPKVSKIVVEHIGPHAASDPLIQANIRTKVGDPFSRPSVDDDIKNLYATGFFANIRVDQQVTADGVQLTYIVQGKPILTDLKIVGNKRYKTSKLMKKVTSKVGQPLDERKLFTDAQEIKKVYEDGGYQKTTVKALPPVIDAASGRGTATIEIIEAPKVKIKDIVFDGASGEEFTQRKLRKVIKTHRRWIFSFLTGSGVLKEDQFEDDKDRLTEYYQNEGYIDFAIKDIKFDYVTPTKMVIHFVLSQGQQYKVGSLEFKGNKVYTTNDFLKGVIINESPYRIRMVPGETFTPVGLTRDTDTLRDMYGSKGYLERSGDQPGTTITATKVPNPSTGTMDLVYEIEEGDKSYIEKIEIKGNNKTKDRVLRRELAVTPGEVYDTVRVKLSKERLQNLDYFEKVESQAEETDVSNRKNMVIGVEEKNTGNMMIGAGFSSVDALIGFVEVSQGNFDLFNPPTFTGGGQKFRIKAQVGTSRQDYEIGFIEPWFLGRKLALGVDLFYRDLGFVSLNDVYDETLAGATVSLTRALGSDRLIGKLSYTLEDVDIRINPEYHTNTLTTYSTSPNGLYNNAHYIGPNVSEEIYNERGNRLVSKAGASLAYDNSNAGNISVLSDRGQRTEFSTELAGLGGDTYFYKLELASHWYFRGLGKGHVLELAGQTGVAESYGSSSKVPIFDRYFLGGMSSLRGYRYHEVGPRDVFGEPLGGNTFFAGTIEYSIPVIERVRFAVFYDIGNVYSKSYSFSPGKDAFGNDRKFYNDNYGLGLRINIPMIGPLRLDYGIPITHDEQSGSSGRFQFGVGYQRPF